MNVANLPRDFFELLFVIAVGGTSVTATRRLLRREIPIVRCALCERPISRSYPYCPECGAPTPEPQQ